MAKKRLREAVAEAYGEDFAREIYDEMCSGNAVGGMVDTIVYINMIDAVKADQEARRNREREETTVRIVFGTLMAFGILTAVLLILTIARG